MPAAATPRGLKRICLGCGMRFYDLNKRPIVCPGCKAEFIIETKTKGRRTRPANDDAGVTKAAVVEAPEKETEEEADSDDMVVSLEDVEEGADDIDDDDLPIDDDLDDDDLDDDDLDDDVEEEEEEADKE